MTVALHVMNARTPTTLRGPTFYFIFIFLWQLLKTSTVNTSHPLSSHPCDVAHLYVLELQGVFHILLSYLVKNGKPMEQTSTLVILSVRWMGISGGVRT